MKSFFSKIKGKVAIANTITNKLVNGIFNNNNQDEIARKKERNNVTSIFLNTSAPNEPRAARLEVRR